MKKNIYLVVVTILSIVMCFYCVGLSNMNKALKTQYQQLCDLNESINKELLNYKMDPDKLKQEAYLAFKNEDDEGIKKVVKLLEKYHIETPQCAEAKGYIETLAKIREQRRIAEERKKKAEEKRKEAERIARDKNFKFNIQGIKLGMSRSEYNNLISNLKSSGKLSLYDDNLYSMYWFRSNSKVKIKSYGANSAYNDTFTSPIEYSIILHSKPVFTNDLLTSIEVLVWSFYDDNVIVGCTKNIDLIRVHLNNIFDQSPIEKDNSYYWSKNKQSVVLQKTKYEDWGGLIYYKLRLTR